MSAIYVVTTMVVSTHGQRFDAPMAFAVEKDVAVRIGDEKRDMINALIQNAKLVVAGPNGMPQVVMPLGEFLAQVGIKSIGTATYSGEVQGALAVPPPSRIILPGN